MKFGVMPRYNPDKPSVLTMCLKTPPIVCVLSFCITVPALITVNAFKRKRKLEN